MSYKEYLKEEMDDKNISIKELAKETNISDSYISKILSGKKGAPRDDINRKIAKVLNINEREILLASYLENAPDEINKILDWLIYKSYTMADFIINSNKKEIRNAYGNINIEEYMKNIKPKNRVQSLLQIIKSTTEINEIGEIKINSLNPNNGDFKAELVLKQPIVFEITDDAMAPKIPINSQVSVTPKSQYENGDIVYISEEKIARQIYINGNQCVLSAIDGKNFPPVKKNIKDVAILGKVNEVMIKI